MKDQRFPRHRAVELLPSLPNPQALQFWMGPNAHLLHYAIGGTGEAVNFFAGVEGPAVWPMHLRRAAHAEVLTTAGWD